MKVLPVVLASYLRNWIYSYRLMPYLLVLNLAKAHRVSIDRVHLIACSHSFFREREMSQLLVTHERRLSVQRVKVCKCKHPLFLRISMQTYRHNMLRVITMSIIEKRDLWFLRSMQLYYRLCETMLDKYLLQCKVLFWRKTINEVSYTDRNKRDCHG